MTKIAMASQTLNDPNGLSALTAAVQWLQETLLGTVATTIAVIAVAAVGLGMLSGRIDWKRGVTVVIGCFILFGASSIVAGITSFAADGGVAPSLRAYEPSPLQAIAPLPPTAPKEPYDPYAGAAVPS